MSGLRLEAKIKGQFFSRLMETTLSGPHLLMVLFTSQFQCATAVVCLAVPEWSIFMTEATLVPCFIVL